MSTLILKNLPLATHHSVPTQLARFLFFFIVIISSAASSRAECTSIKGVVQQGFGPIGLINEARLPRRVLHQAINYWRQCDSYGRGFPAFVIEGEDGVKPKTSLTITYVGSSHSLRCASIRGQEITLYAYARRQSGQPIACGDLAQNLAHELGHFLGLNHAAKQTPCKLNIMATIKPQNARRRRVVTEECRAVDQRWLTPFEIEPLSRQAQSERELP